MATNGQMVSLVGVPVPSISASAPLRDLHQCGTTCGVHRLRLCRAYSQCDHTNTTQQPSSGPYRPQTWALGGVADKHIDIPVTAVFLFLFICGAATHMTIFQINRKRGHKFVFNALLFGTSRLLSYNAF
jgi:hypothetical protein